ncbi:alpha/beta fold hydrolase [Mycolicibacterium komossense]|uniref:Alpha/beta hydrolase n=1 Tax=Mycolicibacterium komossense TaxID=1779 RepID=A0ABT3CC23_9MYCO|nr:alpha/beta hydrolase [Mycolicibacterium komossense]MCV7227023.1 alpha/beta hydrolase [Mycolicibacterium komossense]
MRRQTQARPVQLPPSRPVIVRGADGTRLHTEVFGPEDGYPIVLAHGITCAIRVWHEQIADLSRDYRVIAFDHRGHGRSGVPGRGHYSLNHLASDLDAVLEATLAPGERAVIAGHSMGGIAISAWADRYRHRVSRRADAVALINTTTGEIIRQVKLLAVTPRLAGGREVIGRQLIKRFGGMPVVRAAEASSRRFVAALAVGRDADREIGSFVYELYATTPAAGRGGCAKMLIDSLEKRHIPLDGLTVPTLVIGSERDRLLPLDSSRRIAERAPNLVDLLELSGGHCSILECPAEVNAALRALAESASAATKLSS